MFNRLEIAKHIGLDNVVYYTVYYLDDTSDSKSVVLMTNNGFKVIEFISQELQRPPR